MFFLEVSECQKQLLESQKGPLVVGAFIVNCDSDGKSDYLAFFCKISNNKLLNFQFCYLLQKLYL